MRLYYSPRTRAFTALWMLEETGVPYELVRVNISGDADRARIGAVNPMGKLPALEDGATRFGETAAILTYLADKFPEAGLAPAIDAPERGPYLQWMMFPAAVMEPAAMERLNKTQERPTQAGWGSYDRMIAAIDGALAPGQNLFGARFTAADLYCASSLKFMMTFGMVEKRPNFEDYVARAEARPAFVRASAIEAAG
jgi:glutathione S-transferase